MDCIPDELWDRCYGGAPLWQHLYHTLHQLVPHHKISGAGIFINEEGVGTGLHAFYYIGCLGGTAAGIFRKKGVSVFVVGQIIDEQRNIGIADASAVFGTDLGSSIFGNDIFSSVPGNVVVYAGFQCF